MQYRGCYKPLNNNLTKKIMELDEDILFYAFRYALGRSTYAVSDVVQALVENWKEITVSTKETIHKEIKLAIDNDNCGMELDKKLWETVLSLEINLKNK